MGGISITDQITSNINLREGWVLGQRRHAKHEPDTSCKLSLGSVRKKIINFDDMTLRADNQANTMRGQGHYSILFWAFA